MIIHQSNPCRGCGAQSTSDVVLHEAENVDIGLSFCDACFEKQMDEFEAYKAAVQALVDYGMPKEDAANFELDKLEKRMNGQESKS